MNKIAITQGRLSPPCTDHIQAFPRDSWRQEFDLAIQAGISEIEWIIDSHGLADNPILSPSQRNQVLHAQNETGVLVQSVSYDLLMELPILRCRSIEAQHSRLRNLHLAMTKCALAHVRYFVLPFVDGCSIDTQDELQSVVKTLRDFILPSASKHGMQILMETSLPPDQVQCLIKQIPEPSFGINYDTGNSASLGYDPAEEFAAYGDRIRRIHIKDRVLGGGTVILGAGNADLETVFTCMVDRQFDGTLVLQVARGASGDEVACAAANKQWLIDHLSTA